jgi:hypothetical protein
MSTPAILPEHVRRRAVTAAIGLTADTPLAPKRYERELLVRFRAGEISLDQMLELLDTSTYYILYRSRAIGHPTPQDLQALLEYARACNAQEHITGLLLYCDQEFVQVLEGPAAAVRALYARIQADTRHTQVVTLSEGPGPQRWFAEWQMAFGYVRFTDLHLVMHALEHHQVPPVPMDDPYLCTLLAAFAQPEPAL